VPQKFKFMPQLEKNDNWIDISAPISPDTTPIFPEDPPARFYWVKQLAKGDKLNLSDFDMGAHTATHVDAPLHFIENGGTIDQVPLSRLIGPARVIAVDAKVEVIDAAELRKHDLAGVTRVLFKTRASVNSWLETREFHKDYTGIAPDAARALVSAGMELVGVDYLSAEQFSAKNAPSHKSLLGHDVLIVEGLNLHNVNPGDYTLIVLPIKLVGREAAPARALLQKR
jgi:arylformamidase